MKRKKRISSIVLIIWFLFVIIFLSAWNADRFVSMMGRELQGINFENAKWRTSIWDTYYTEYFRFMEPLAELSGLSYLALGKKSVDNYLYVKDENGNMQLLEDDFDHAIAEARMLKLADAFTRRDIPFVFASLPPRFANEDFTIANELDFFGQRDEHLLSAMLEAGIAVLDAGKQLKEADKPYLYPFKTDIHLETEGEFEMARLLHEKLTSLGIEIKDADMIFNKENYTVKAYPFAGNLVKSSGTSYTGGVDSFELWYPDFDTDLTVKNPEKKKPTKTGSFAESVMNGMETPKNLAKNANPYWVLNYLQYPSPYYEIENNLNKDGCRILFIMDSYAMRTASYLSLGAGTVTVIDPRGEGSGAYLTEAMESGEYDAVIAAGGGKTFYDSLYVID